MVLKERVYKLIPVSTHIEVMKRYRNTSTEEYTYLIKNHNEEEFEATSEVLTLLGCKQLIFLMQWYPLKVG